MSSQNTATSSSSHDEAATGQQVKVQPHRSKKTVEESYDKIAPAYLEWTTSFASPRLTYLNRLISLMPSSSTPPSQQTRVLELGCGAGIPCTQILAKKGSVVAVDISAAQLELARKNIPGPGVEFKKADMGDLEFEEGSFDAVVGFYSLIHLPRDEQTALVKRIFGWLKVGGHLLANFSTNGEEESWGGDWLGSEMFWSGWDVEGSLGMVKSAGFEVIDGKVETEDEGPQKVDFLWVIAKKTEATI